MAAAAAAAAAVSARRPLGARSTANPAWAAAPVPAIRSLPRADCRHATDGPAPDWNQSGEAEREQASMRRGRGGVSDAPRARVKRRAADAASSARARWTVRAGLPGVAGRRRAPRVQAAVRRALQLARGGGLGGRARQQEGRGGLLGQDRPPEQEGGRPGQGGGGGGWRRRGRRGRRGWRGRKEPIYKIYPPQGSPFTRLYRVLRGAWRNRKLPLPADPSGLYEDDPTVPLAPVPSGELAPSDDEEQAAAKTRRGGLFGKKTKKSKGPKAPPHLAERMPHTEGMAYLDKAAIRGAHTHGRSQRPITVSVVEESKAFYRIMPIFALVIIYQMAYDPIFTLLPYPGDVMDRRIGSEGAVIPASSISFANTFGVLLTVPLYDLVIVPLATKLKHPITVTQRIGAGFFIEILALVSAGVIESVRYRQAVPIRALYEADGGGPDTSSPDPLDAKYSQPMSIWVQALPYFLLGASEAFTNVGVMELFYCGVSSGMRSIGTACYLLTVAMARAALIFSSFNCASSSFVSTSSLMMNSNSGTYLATALNLIIAAATSGNGDGGWVANNSLYGHYDWYFYVNAAILLVALIIYIPVSKRYVERPVADADGDPFDREGRAHAELANVSRVWPSVSRASRVSELRLRSQASVAMARSRPGSVGAVSARRGSAAGAEARAAAEAVAVEQANVWER